MDSADFSQQRLLRLSFFFLLDVCETYLGKSDNFPHIYRIGFGQYGTLLYMASSSVLPALYVISVRQTIGICRLGGAGSQTTDTPMLSNPHSDRHETLSLPALCSPASWRGVRTQRKLCLADSPWMDSQHQHNKLGKEEDQTLPNWYQPLGKHDLWRKDRYVPLYPG